MALRRTSLKKYPKMLPMLRSTVFSLPRTMGPQFSYT